MRPHAFVAMPFGTKKDAEGKDIDFNRVYTELIRPALEDAGCEVFRADEEVRAGDIRTDMFQELLVADLVVADLTLDNPNVWYELGVRHALRARGVVLIQGPRPHQPFDIYTDRKLRYGLENGGPDPASREKDRTALATMARETLDAPVDRPVSPVYALLDHLREPQWRDLLLADRNEFSAAYEEWSRRLEVARRKGLPGDVLVLADETPTRALQVEAKRAAGNGLLKLQHFGFALEQFEAALKLDPKDKPSREKKSVCLGRLGRYEEAREWTARLTEDHPRDAEAWALLGRVEKDEWVRRWRWPDAARATMRQVAAAEDARLREAIGPYERAFRGDPSHFYSGINALTLRLLHSHLTEDKPDASAANLEGGLRWAITAALERDPKDYWARSTQAELLLLVADGEAIRRGFRASVAAAGGDWFALDSTRQTLALLRDMEFRPAETAAAMEIVEAELGRATPPFAPEKVLLFSGHIMDAPTRPIPRFAVDKEEAAARRIAEELERLGAGPGDLALCQGAAGGDLLFLEACRERGIRCRMMLPFDEPEFLRQSVIQATHGDRWRERYFAVKGTLEDPVRIMPAELGPPPKGASPFERCNLWLLYTALAWGPDNVRFVCLWNGGGGDGPGGTQHMYKEVERRTGRVTWIDTRTL